MLLFLLSRKKGAWEQHAALSKVVENHDSGTAFEMIVASCFMFQTLIVAASLVVAKSVFNRSDR